MQLSERECAVCSEQKDELAFPSTSTTRDCEHTQATCLPCLRASIAHDIERMGTRDITCPECSARLDYADVILHADEKSQARYEKLLVRLSMEGDEAFVWVSISSMLLGTRC